ncbi:phosphoglycerate dehydrogenase [Melissococcus plutonius]|nr:phosphoglycerate dehydrogenase [Melissococcus plutonius]MCV2498530.1 phosphoglycerate dehydrogenase [Melissococcus plutonius]MCV2501089.1 phosphoglycerate dehydrogenase [Melissococcus plutonius]MCV2504802.1 phosphoglycerate dehydrogenase [Melissococcus plutonius]MCV2507262.1 phosphoglycerate dehydrogenase [Melissococcus plutonius]MCV2519236.1 phosphoglycerate dehydrogenase [Melissococcus plutonius]
MTQPIIYLTKPLDTKQIQKIQQFAKNYLVIDASKNVPSFDEEDIEISLGWDEKLEERLLESSTSQLKWIQTISAGIDTFDLKKLANKGILLSNGGGLYDFSIAEYVIGVLLTKFRGIKKSIQLQEEKKWAKNAIEPVQLTKQKLLIVGTGKIGQQIAQLAEGFGLKIYGINTSGHSVSHFIKCYSQKEMIQVVSEMDIVVNILPLTKDTYHLYNDKMFHAMKKGVIFVNVGRGPSVNTVDLIHALDEKILSFAALDVFEDEPLEKDSPLWEMENVLITPHIAGLTPGITDQLFEIFLSNLKSYIQKKDLVINKINLTRGY